MRAWVLCVAGLLAGCAASPPPAPLLQPSAGDFPIVLIRHIVNATYASNGTAWPRASACESTQHPDLARHVLREFAYANQSPILRPAFAVIVDGENPPTGSDHGIQGSTIGTELPAGWTYSFGDDGPRVNVSLVTEGLWMGDHLVRPGETYAPVYRFHELVATREGEALLAVTERVEIRHLGFFHLPVLASPDEPVTCGVEA